ncbi:MAG: phytanoyl-CoA dioxygenase family protein [Proteobacteria bacterium]|nr:phytanoyl-CoA dioxygenase family protein [Pseudomonadota bacterium]
MNSPPRSASIAPGSAALGPAERATFEHDGLLVLRAWSPPELVAAAREAAVHQLDTRQPPLELEAEVGYPGAPASTSTPGGQTVRRLLRAHDRGEAFRALATSTALGQVLRELMLPAGGNGSVLMAQAHHNCVMTKMPSYSSQTNWHQDVRYWSYRRPELISAWFALGSETDENGCLSFIPGTHRMNFGRDRLDDQLFLRTDREDNQALIASAVAPALAAGDLVLFHCRLFHAAGRNRTQATKFSLVCTYRAEDNLPLPGTKSASTQDVAV